MTSELWDLDIYGNLSKTKIKLHEIVMPLLSSQCIQGIEWLHGLVVVERMLLSHSNHKLRYLYRYVARDWERVRSNSSYTNGLIAENWGSHLAYGICDDKCEEMKNVERLVRLTTVECQWKWLLRVTMSFFNRDKRVIKYCGGTPKIEQGLIADYNEQTNRHIDHFCKLNYEIIRCPSK